MVLNMSLKLVVACVAGTLTWKYGLPQTITNLSYTRTLNAMTAFCFSYTVVSGIYYICDWLYPEEIYTCPMTRKN